MPAGQTSQVLQHLRRAVLLRDGAGLTDGQLLEGFVSRREEAALAALVRRHGPMVWGVCRRLLRNHHDAEDAFQATFLVLVRRAASIVPREMVANWLYGVAHQTALKARATAARRKGRERQVAEMPEPAAADQELWRDLQPLLDDALSRLPDKYRAVLVLCDLEAKTRKEAARQLGVPEGTVAGRLARARALLAKRLARHGLALSGGALALVLAQNVASAVAPTSVVSSTIQAATAFAAGPAAAAGMISAQVAALTQGVLKTMLLSKLKIATAVLLGVLVCGGGTLALLPVAAGYEDAQANSPQANADDKKTDKDKLQGKWVPVSGEAKGEKFEAADNEKLSAWTLTFDGDNVTMPGNGQELKASYTLDPAKTPKAMDIEVGGQLGTMKAIYEFDGDKLKWSWDKGNAGERPPDFDTSKSTAILIIFEKMKE